MKINKSNSLLLLLLLISVFIATKLYLQLSTISRDGSEEYSEERENTPISYTYWEKENNRFSVTYPVDWFEQTDDDSIPLGAPGENLGKSKCNETIERCLDKMISVRTIQNNNKLPLDSVVKAQKATQGGRITPMTLGPETPAYMVDNVSQGNALRYIYFDYDNTVLEVELLNIGQKDVDYFDYSFEIN